MKILLQTLLLCLIMTQLQAQSQQQDYTALRALYLSTDGDNWFSKDSTDAWPDAAFFIANPNIPAGMDVGTWYGVRTDADGFVDCIDMDGVPNCDWQANNGNNLTGIIPAEIGQLMNLEELRLIDNNLSASIPPEIGDLSNLIRLNLVRNDLSGEIPFEILNLSNLTHLSLGANELTGSIFPEFSTLINLIHLSLDYNNLSGGIPPELGELSNLEYLWLGGNQLSGSIPPELGQLSNLEKLFLYDNQLSGSIPPELGQLSNLRQLRLYGNQLSASIPIELGNLSNLTYLDLGNNELIGNIPSEIGNLTDLEYLHLDNNQLTGNILQEIGNLTSLEYLYLNNNQLTGSIPLKIGSLSNLIELRLSYNQLSGNIPQGIGNLANLEELYLDNNQLTGNILPEIGNLINLTDLNLSDNALSGNIPSDLGQLINLTDLNLKRNELSGEIPSEIANLSNLIRLNFGANDLSGNIPSGLGDLINLTYFNLSYNDLTGNIPPELGQLSNLTYLSLSNNELSASIPPELGQLSNLEKLLLYNNQLTGNIPSDLGDLSNLTNLHLYNNQLSGCYDPNLLNLCNLLSASSNTNEYISNGNNFDASWEDFCNMTIGICNLYPQTDAMFVIQALEVDDVANETRFEVHLNSDTPISGYAVSTVINVGTAIDINDIQIYTDGSTLDPDTIHIDMDDDGNIHITVERTDTTDQIIDGLIFSVVIMDDILPLIIMDVVIMDDIFPLMINGGYILSSTGGFIPIGGSTLYGHLDALISLGLNHAYCDNKGRAKIYVEDASNYIYEWSTGETTPSIGDLDIGSYTVTVSDGMDTKEIPFDINWAFTPVNIITQSRNITTKRNGSIHINFEEAPLTEDVEISFDGGFSYRPPIRNDIVYSLPDGTYSIWMRRVGECSTYIDDFKIGNGIPPNDDFPEYLINPPSEVTARLDYELKEHGTVDISLYNIHGQMLHTIHKATSGIGEYQIEIDKAGLPKGIYLIYIHFISNDGAIGYKTLKLLI